MLQELVNEKVGREVEPRTCCRRGDEGGDKIGDTGGESKDDADDDDDAGDADDEGDELLVKQLASDCKSLTTVKSLVAYFGLGLVARLPWHCNISGQSSRRKNKPTMAVFSSPGNF